MARNNAGLSFMVILFMGLLWGSSWASDPDPLQDFCVADHAKSKDIRINGFVCKDPSRVSVEDFVFSGIRNAGNCSVSPTGFAGTSVNVMQFAGLNTMGMSVVRADFMPGGVNVPHLHPRATEIGYVVQGTLFSGFVNSNSSVYAKIISQGDLMVFPRGLVHFQMNVGKTPAVVIGTFNSQNPGLLKLPSSLFGTGLPDELLQKSFKLSKRQVRILKSRFAGGA